MFAASLVVTSWIAVGWHRHALRGERPARVAPLWHGGLVAAYVWKAMVIGLLMRAVAAVPLFLVSALLVGALGASGLAAAMPVLTGLIGIPAIWLLLRLSLGLPAVAVGEKLSIAGSWRATGPVQANVLIPAAAIGLLEAATGAAQIGLAEVSPRLAAWFSIPVGWGLLMLSVAVLTTLYGHLIEGRELG